MQYLYLEYFQEVAMKKIYKNSLVISVLTTIALGIGSQAFASQARALFLSTAGAQVTYKETEKTETTHKVYAYQPKEHKVYYQKVSETIPAGLSVQVMKVSRNGSALSLLILQFIDLETAMNL
jgi:hypothetical protein